MHHWIVPRASFRRGFRAGQGSPVLRTLNEVASIRGTCQYRGLQSQRAPPGAPRAPWDHNSMKIGGSLRAVWITISALGLRCESQGGPGLVVIHYNGYELPSKSSWAGLCSPWASVGNRLFCAPLAKLSPSPKNWWNFHSSLAGLFPNAENAFPTELRF